MNTDFEQNSRLHFFVAATLLTCACLTSAHAKVVNAAKWPGFEPANATKALQAALDSGADKVIVPDVGQPWIVTPLQFRSDQTVIFESGVVILAKEGAFQGLNDCLFTARGVKNLTVIGDGATWRMRKSDYAAPPYAKSEWRNTLSILGCTNVTVEGLALEASGGDGIYISGGAGKAYSENITIRNVICDDHYRQGISVISADHLLMENVILRDTGGTPPMAGIDFEPNRPSQRLSHIVMRNCLTWGNAGNGYALYLLQQNASSDPISISFQHCRAIGDHAAAVSITTANTADQAPRGHVTFTDCVFRGSRGSGIVISKPAEVLGITFRDCVLDRVAMGSVAFPIQFASRSGATGPIGGVVFDQVRIMDPQGRPPIGYVARSADAPLENVTGTLVVPGAQGARPLPLTKQLLDKWNPAQSFASVPYVALDDVQWVPPADSPRPAGIKIGKADIRKQARYALYAREGDRVEVNVLFGQVGHYSAQSMPVTVTGPGGKTVYHGELPFKTVSSVSFLAPASGLYLLSARPGVNFVRVENATHPICLVTPKGSFDLYGSAGTYYFWVPKGTRQFAVQGAGDGAEGFRMVLKRPGGQTVKDLDNIRGLQQITVTPTPTQTGATWELRIKPASDVAFEDHSVKLLGVPPLLAATRQTVIRSR